MKIISLDHLVLTVSDFDRAVRFYTTVLGMGEATVSHNRKALLFGKQKINLHLKGYEPEPKARRPTPGSADLCFIVEDSLHEVIPEIKKYGIAIEDGPVERSGGAGNLLSIYVRDPDGNLIEIANVKEPG